MSRQIDTLLVDDHALLRKGLAALLAAEADITVVGEAGDGEEAIAQVQALQPDVVIMDISMPGLSGIDATRQIRAESPDSQVIALSIHSSKRFVDDMLDAGASGYLLKESAPEELVRSIHAVMRGEMYLSSAITSTVVSAYVEGMAKESRPAVPGTEAGVLRTKLHRPASPKDLVPRTKLLERLEAGRVRPLILVSAAAGFGKSVLISSWLDRTDWPAAWYTLDKSDRDLSQFLNYFVEALQGVFPDACSETRALTSAPRQPSLSVVGKTLSNELDAIDRPFILVLDDYQHIDATSAVNELLFLLLKHPPIPLHLVIIDRRDPPLQLVQLRARDQMTEIRSDELKFSTAETDSLIRQVAPFAASPEAIDCIQQQVEGWVVGLRLVSLALQHTADPERLIAGLHGGMPSVQDYLFQEVLNPLPLEAKQWLLRTAILGRFCASVCDAVCVDLLDATAPPAFDGKQLIKKLIVDNLFLIPLDTQRKWFRYHSLFQEFLLIQLKQTVSSNAIGDLHLQASQWFETNNLLEEAIDHALQGKDTARAVEIIERHSYAQLDLDRWYIIERWLGLIPPEELYSRPMLVLFRAWVAFFRQKIAELPAIIERLELLLDRDSRTAATSGQLAFFHGYLGYWSGEADHGQPALEEAFRLIPETAGLISGEIQLHLSLARCMNGQSSLAIEKLNQQLNRPRPPSGLFASRLLGALAISPYTRRRSAQGRNRSTTPACPGQGEP